MYMQKLAIYFNGDKRKLTDVTAQKTKLINFYRGQFSQAYAKLNPSAPTDPAAVVDKLDNIGIALQSSYVATDAKFGDKLNLVQPDDGLTYSNAHGESHRVLKRLFEKLDVEDMYLVDPNGYVVYSVQKYPDFATNLNTGPYKDSALAHTYQAAIKSGDYAFVAISDIAPHPASFNQPALFIASPIQNLEVDDSDEILGVLVLKVSPAEINAIMTSDAKWKDIGMGASGDAFLVGADKTLRSNYRALIQDKVKFTQQIHKLFDPALLQTMTLQNSAVDRLRIDNPAVQAALAGKSGVSMTQSITGEPTLTAYAPLTFKNLKWAVISEIHADEALAASKTLAHKIGLTGLILAVLMIGIAVVVGVVFATRITKPVIRMSRTMHEIEATSDLTQRIDVSSRDEIGSMAIAMNHMLDKFRHSLEQVAASTTMLATASEEMSSITQTTNQNVNRQFSEIDQVATAINEMTATVQEVASHASKAARAAQEANAQSRTGRQVVESSIDSISELSHDLEEVSTVIDKLSKHSENIGMVMDVIKGISEQTNLLALNAAIEAARAGEQGRGFAVVADEVRTLASRTQKSTVEIQNMIEQLQKEAHDAVSAVKRSRERSEQNVQNAASAGDSLQTITHSVTEINDMNTMIASAAEEQSAVTEEINKNIVSIREAAEQTTQGAGQTTAASEELSKLAAELQQLVAQFKTA
jgi:methyl-accepting chemotaxis protein